jgi:SAM-dependent methyltransferase
MGALSRGRRDERATFDEADAELASTLDNLDDAHNYRDWIFALLEPYLGPKVLEVGAGHGSFTELLSAGRHVTATDLSERCVEVLRARFAGNPAVTVALADLASSAAGGPYDSVVLINVLEHIADDDAALDLIRSLLVPGGRLVVWVPAFMQLYSDFDRRIGHYRRYHLPGLRAQLVAAGLSVDDIRYVNSVGAAAWWLVARVLRRAPTGKAGVTVYDRCVVPALRRIESRWSPPLGQSVLAVATAPA